MSTVVQMCLQHKLAAILVEFLCLNTFVLFKVFFTSMFILMFLSGGFEAGVQNLPEGVW